ncbi:MAG: hypothetical protein M1480_18670 [Bacteroidetes bacterium]|nr:hypothetical protein [Bacteroidota bacterium]
MKVYESSYPTKRDYKNVPQIKIKNYKLGKSGFNIGKEFRIVYGQNKIILEIIEEQKANS